MSLPSSADDQASRCRPVRGKIPSAISECVEINTFNSVRVRSVSVLPLPALVRVEERWTRDTAGCVSHRLHD
jgi:hypothetical protein